MTAQTLHALDAFAAATASFVGFSGIAGYVFGALIAVFYAVTVAVFLVMAFKALIVAGMAAWRREREGAKS